MTVDMWISLGYSFPSRFNGQSFVIEVFITYDYLLSQKLIIFLPTFPQHLFLTYSDTYTHRVRLKNNRLLDKHPFTFA